MVRLRRFVVLGFRLRVSPPAALLDDAQLRSVVFRGFSTQRDPFLIT